MGMFLPRPQQPHVPHVSYPKTFVPQAQPYRPVSYSPEPSSSSSSRPDPQPDPQPDPPPRQATPTHTTSGDGGPEVVQPTSWIGAGMQLASIFAVSYGIVKLGAATARRLRGTGKETTPDVDIKEHDPQLVTLSETVHQVVESEDKVLSVTPHTAIKVFLQQELDRPPDLVRLPSDPGAPLPANEIEVIFRKSDTNMSGSISLVELKAFMTSMSQRFAQFSALSDMPSDHDLELAFRAYDKDKNGMLDREEFEEFAHEYLNGVFKHHPTVQIPLQSAVDTFLHSSLAPPTGQQFDQVQLLFDRADKDHNGKVSLAELQGFVNQLALEFCTFLDVEANPDSVKEAFDSVDVDEDGFLSRDEFALFCAKYLHMIVGLKL